MSKKVYVVNVENIPDGKTYKDLTDDEFMSYAEYEGTIYSLRGFENAVNQDDFDSVNSVIRII
jgi:hypothetical protein